MVFRLFMKIPMFSGVRNVRLIHRTSIFNKLTQFILSDIGEGIREVTIREWFVKVGDKVTQFDNICLVESDKASVNISSRYDGVIKAIHYQTGDIALVGKPLVEIDTIDEGEHSVEVKQVEDHEAATETASEIQIADSYDTGHKKLATPAVRRIALENNISLQDVPGTGKGGRIMKEDILNFLKKPSEQTEMLDKKDGVTPISGVKQILVPITGIKKVMVRTMTESGKIPTFSYCDEINVSKLVEFRNELKALAKTKGINITYLPFFIKALSKCIEKFPELNSSIDENCENIIIKTSHNIGIAVDTPNGLVVPNIKNVQNLTVAQINAELNLLTERGRNNQLTPADFSQGTISISNIGAIGGTYAKPLINSPEVCILGIGKFRTVPIFSDNNEVVKSESCYLSWTADHRIIDGATMARFSNMFKQYIEAPRNLVIEL